MLPPFLDVKRCNVVLELVLFDLTECLITQLLVLFHVRCLREFIHEPSASAVKPRLRDCSRLSRFQVRPACPADGVVPVPEAKPVPECKECVRPLPTPL